MPYIYGYVRVSTGLQDDKKTIVDGKLEDNSGLATHTREIEDWYKRGTDGHYPNHKLGGIFQDAAQSSQIPLNQRDQGPVMLSYLQPGDVMVVVDLDRAFGSATDFEATLATLQRKGCKLHCLAMQNVDFDECEGEMMGSFRSIMKRYECRVNSRRQKIAYHSKESVGRVTGRYVPLGYRKVVTIDPDTQRPLRYFAPCEREQWLLRIFRWLRQNDLKEWTREKYDKWVRENDIRRGPKNKQRYFDFAEFAAAGVIVANDFPLQQLVHWNRGYRRDRISAGVGPSRRRLAPSERRQPQRVSSVAASELWNAPAGTSVVKLQRQQYREQVAREQAAASQSPGS